MERLLIAAAIVAVAVAVALVVRARRRPDAPAQVSRAVPSQLDRADFAHMEADWLVVVFTSATCDTCAAVLAAARALADGDVGVVEVEYRAHRALHERYRIEAVPMVVVADRAGVVRASHLGRAPAGLSAVMAAARAADA